MFFCIAACSKKEKAAVPLETIRIGTFKGEFAALVWLADIEGYFAKNGLKAEVTGYESGVAAVEALMAGTQDIATAADTVFVRKALALESNSAIKILGVIARSDSIEIVARTDRGITKPADLKGKKIALTSKAPSDYFLDRYLLDTEGRIKRFNDAFACLSGKSADEIAGHYCFELMHGTAAFIENCPFVRALSSGKRESLELETGAAWFQVTIYPVFDESGKGATFNFTMAKDVKSIS